MSSSSTHKVYEEGRYYNEETNIVDGRKEEFVESEQWTRGSPTTRDYFDRPPARRASRPEERYLLPAPQQQLLQQQLPPSSIRRPSRPRRSRDYQQQQSQQPQYFPSAQQQQQPLGGPHQPPPLLRRSQTPMEFDSEPYYQNQQRRESRSHSTTADVPYWAPTPVKSAYYNDPPPYSPDQPFAPPPELYSFRRSSSNTAHNDMPICGGHSGMRAGSPGRVAGASEITNTDGGFTIRLDVRHFAPHEIKVSMSESTLVVEGQHIDDDGQSASLKRNFSRKYNIPDDIDYDTINSTVNDYGILTVKGARKPTRGWRETDIPIQLVGRPSASTMHIPRPTANFTPSGRGGGGYVSDV